LPVSEYRYARARVAIGPSDRGSRLKVKEAAGNSTLL
jgi:hypothetical protein